VLKLAIQVVTDFDIVFVIHQSTGDFRCYRVETPRQIHASSGFTHIERWNTLAIINESVS